MRHAGCPGADSATTAGAVSAESGELITPIFSYLGAYARPALAAGVFIGILLPDLAALLRPLLVAAVIGTLTTALLRLDWQQIIHYLHHPWFALLLTVWQLLLSPLIVWFSASLFGLPPALSMILVLQSAAPPIGSAAVFALMIGLNGEQTILATVMSVLLLPLALTPLVAFLLGAEIEIDLLAFFLRVTLLVALPFFLAGILRWIITLDRLQRNDALLGGSNVLLLVIFAIAVMDGVTLHLLENPWSAGVLLLTACIMAVVLHIGAYIAFSWAGREPAFSAAICSGNRNMGLMLAITTGVAGGEFSLYAGIAQIPMYFVPMLMAPLVRTRMP